MNTPVKRLLILSAFCLGCLPGLSGAADQCVLGDEATLIDYLNRLAQGLNTTVDYRYSEGRGGGMRLSDTIIPAEKPFVRGAAAITEGDLFFTVQFDRSGKVTTVDVRRQVQQAEYEILARLFGECLDPYQQELAALNSYIAGHVQYQLGEEAARKAKLEEDS